MEMIQLVTQGLWYMRDWFNFVEVAQYTCTIIFVVIYQNQCFCVSVWQWQVGVAAVFLGWIVVVFYMVDLPFVGIYVLILIRICMTFFKFIILALLLIFTFGFTFHMIFYDRNVSVSSLPQVV